MSGHSAAVVGPYDTLILVIRDDGIGDEALTGLTEDLRATLGDRFLIIVMQSIELVIAKK